MIIIFQAVEEYERKLEQEKKSKPVETIIVDTQVADIFKQRRENVEKHVVESEPSQSGESGSEMRSTTNYTMPVLKDSNYKKEVKVTQVMPKVTTQVIHTTPIKQQQQGAIVNNRRDVSPKYSLSKSTPDVRMDTQTSVSSISMAPLRTEGQMQQTSRQIQLQRAVSSTTPPTVGKENIQPHLRKAKTVDSGMNFSTM